MVSLKLARRLNQIESRLRPAEPHDPAFYATRARFLALLADDPFYSLVVAPEFRLAQLRILAERGTTLKDITPSAGVPIVHLDCFATVDVPDGAAWDAIWLCLDPRAAPIRDVLDHTEKYLDAVWERATT